VSALYCRVQHARGAELLASGPTVAVLISWLQVLHNSANLVDSPSKSPSKVCPRLPPPAVLAAPDRRVKVDEETASRC
jgi:hypothetical protein